MAHGKQLIKYEPVGFPLVTGARWTCAGPARLVSDRVSEVSSIKVVMGNADLEIGVGRGCANCG